MKPAAMTDDGVNTYGKDNTYGGYSNVLVVKEDFVLKVPENLPIEAAAPILCADVTIFTTDKDKIDEGRALGASEVIIEGDKDAFKKLELSFDFILSTIPKKYRVDPFITLLKRDATYCAVGALDQIPGYNNQELVMHRRSLAGSLIGSIRETQEVLDFCAEHGIAPDVEVIDIQDVNKAYKKVKDEDVRFRYVIDMASLKREMAEAA